MECSNCGAKNPSKKKFCGECGAQLVRERPQPAQPEGTSRRGVPGIIWLLVGAVLVALLFLLLMWTGVINVPGRLAFPGPVPSATGRSYFEVGAPRPTNTPRTSRPSSPTSTSRPPTARPASPTSTKVPVSDLYLWGLTTTTYLSNKHLAYEISTNGPDYFEGMVPVSCIAACVPRDEGNPPPYPGAWDVSYTSSEHMVIGNTGMGRTDYDYPLQYYPYCYYTFICCVDIGSYDPNSSNNCSILSTP